MTIPSITDEDDWKTWARKLSVFLSTQEDRGGRALAPQPILLSHATESASNIGLERNFVEGIMLYDPVNQYVIISKNGLWVPIFDAVSVASIFGASAYGSMDLLVSASGPDIPVGAGNWLVVDQFTTNPTSGRGMVLDPTTDTFSFDFDGLYRISIMFSIEHNEINSGRRFSVRLFNVTSGLGLHDITVGIGRNNGVTNFTGSFLIEIDTDHVGDSLRLEVGQADTIISSVVWETLNLSIDMVSEWREPLTA